MTGVDGMAAAQTLLGYDSVTPGYCLKYVWQAYKAHGAVSDGKSYPTAYSAWQQSDPATRHEGDWNPPPGVPVYFGPKSSSSAGDIVISTGGGRCAATDWPHNGVTGETTLADRQRQVGRPYLGWTEEILGYPVDLGDGGTDQGDDMPTRTTAIDRRTRTLTKGVWQTLYMNEEGTAASIASGQCIGMSTAVVVCQGLPAGAEVQFRLLKTKAGSSESRGATGAREAAATAGGTYATMTDNFELTKSDDGIRWQYAVQHDGVTVTKTEVETLIWAKA